MAHTLAIAFIHGIGRTEPGYSAPMQHALARRFMRTSRSAPSLSSAELVFEEVNWSAALQTHEDRLWSLLSQADPMRFTQLRHFMMDFAADAIAYQPIGSERSAYDTIHASVAEALKRLAERAGERAPLCLITHSLGTVIASNYVYDIAKPRRSFISADLRARIGDTPLERGDTLSLFYTMGSPIALWSLRYPGFGDPIRIPPRKLALYHPKIRPEWVNFYDPDDVIGYPLRPLNPRYHAAVNEDRAVNVGSLLTSWNPLSHTGYWADGGIAETISEGLERVWRASSALALVPKRRRRAKVQEVTVRR